MYLYNTSLHFREVVISTVMKGDVLQQKYKKLQVNRKGLRKNL